MSLLFDALKKTKKEKADIQDKITTDSTAPISPAADAGPAEKAILSLDIGPDQDDSDTKAIVSPGVAANKTTADPVAQQSARDSAAAYSSMLDESGTADEETLQRISATELLREAGTQDQPTLVTEETVFVIGRAVSGSTLTWKTLSLLIFLSCSVLLFLFFIGSVWFTEEPVNTKNSADFTAITTEAVRSDTVAVRMIDAGTADLGAAKRPEKKATEVTDTIRVAASDTAAAGADTTTPPTDTGAGPAAAIDATEPDDDYAAITKQRGVTATEDTASSGTDTNRATIVADCSKPSDNTALCRTNVQNLQRLPEAVPLDNAKSITIRKTPPEPGPAILLKQAFSAYQAGAYAEANSIYQAVLASAPDNRDALLGSAAVAVQRHELEAAQRHYLRLLELNPGDKTALAAMISLYGKRDLLRSERIIKSLLSDATELPYLHFVLGNIYAAQSRWLDAQQAFFDAYQRAPENPHYALNLAISLDHIGQYKAALEYYTIAAQQVYDDPSFDVVTIRLRMQELSEKQAATL